MKNQNIPNFIQNTPHGKDKYEGKSADRVAIAIKNHIENYSNEDNLAKIIGLDGEWGSGKSNIIRILTSKLGDNYYLFEYDAWGNQEDLQRRSFLEQLTKKLIDESILDGETTISKRDGGEETVLWNEKLKYLLAQKKETISEKYPRISNGMAAAGAVAILTPIFVFIAYAFKPQQPQWWWTLISVLISMIPVLVSLVVWRQACKKDKRYNDLGYLLAIYNDKIENDVNYETISEDEPSVTEFKSWMNDISNFIETNNKKKLIVVFDNMDRLPANKVKELWSSIHTFFSEDSYKNIWVIIPFDKKHLANAFGEESNGETLELTSHFINKTFPVIYRVAPPIVTDWKKTFNEFYDDAFGKVEDKDKSTILRIFGISKIQFTPRDIIAFINELVSLKRTWSDEIPLLYISVFVLKKDEILRTPITSILSGSYLGSIEKIIENNAELQKYISALAFGIDSKLAEQVPLKQYLQRTLKGEPSLDINKYADNKHFISILDDEIKDLDPAMTDNAIMSLLKLDNKNGINVTPQWNELVKLHLKQEVPNLSFTSTHQGLLLNADDTQKKIFAKYLYNSFIKQKEFNGSLFYTSMQAFDNFITTNKLNVDISKFTSEYIEKPEIFIDYMHQAKENYKDYKLICDNKELNEYLIDSISPSMPEMDFIQHLVKDSSYSFDLLLKKIELVISSNEITDSNFPEIIKSYKLISKDKPLEQQLNTSQIQTLNSQITDETNEAYYDIIAMGLTNRIIDIPYSEGLDEKIAKLLEFYSSYGDLLILSKDWGSDLLRKSVKMMTSKSYGKKLQLLEILPYFEEIMLAIDISSEILLEEITKWENSISEITIENIESIIPKYVFYEYSSETKNKLTTHINKIAVEKLKHIPHPELFTQRNTETYYWLNCASILIKNKIIITLPDNLTTFCKDVLIEIASGNQAIPISNSILETIIIKANKNKLQPTINIICDDFCNKTKMISPTLFIYFASNFDFINKRTSRAGDITRNILNDVILDENCLNLILENSAGYIKKIQEAGSDAEDLKAKILQMIQSDPSVNLLEFASEIGVNIEPESEESEETINEV